MSVNSNLPRILISTLLVLSLSLIAFGDTLRLRDGSIIKGKIISFSGGKFTVAMGEGSRRKELVFMASEVDSILFDQPGGNSPASDAVNRNASYDDPVKDAPLIISPKGNPSSPADQTQPNEKMKPIEWRIKVLADNTSNGWTNTGWVVKKGQRIRISGDGRVQLGKGQSSTPAGNSSLNDDQKLLKNVATGALLAVIGDDNNDFIYVGAEREFTASRDGALFLGINEGYLEDNSGSYNVKVEILPDI